MKLTIATRGSQLALWQAEYVRDSLKEIHNIDVEIKVFKTTGDKILDTPLAKIGGKGLFTKEIEEAMARGEAQIAVHSLKDFPITYPDEFVLSAITERADERDAFLSQKYKSIQDLPEGAVVGTTSLRRKMQLLIERSDLNIQSLRGNINSRIKKLKDGEFDAIILAKVGIDRLKLNSIVNYLYPIDKSISIPPMGQGALAIETIKDKRVIELVSALNSEKSFIESKIERDFVGYLNGGCQAPIGVNAQLSEDKKEIDIRAIIGYPNGEKFLKEELRVSKDEYREIGVLLAKEFIKQGATEILKEAEKLA